jgi:hypothetical protein
MTTATVKKATKKVPVQDKPELQSCLIDKTVKLKFIPKNTNRLTNNISESTAFTGTSRSIILPKDARTGRYIKVLSFEEQAFLEEKLGVNLDVSRIENNYWDKVRITLRKDDRELDNNFVELDLSDPHMYIQWKVLLAAQEVANSATEQFMPYQLFFIEDDEVDDVRRYSIEEDMDRATEFKLKLKGNRTAIYDFLRVYAMSDKSLKIGRKDSIEYMYSKLGSLIREPRSLQKVLKVIDQKAKDEAAYHITLMIVDAIQIGEIVHTNKGFEAVNGTYIGADMNEAVTFFKNPSNKGLQNKIRQQIDLQLIK